MFTIANKVQMYRLLRSGILGNTTPHYTIAEWVQLTVEEIISTTWAIRKGRRNQPTKYDYHWTEIERYYQHGDYIAEKMEDSTRLLEAEFVYLDGVLRLHYSTVPAPMKVALAKECFYVEGLRAREILKYYLDYESFYCVEELWHRYTNHAIETSTLTRRTGTLNLNTVIWEVRNY